MRRRRAGTGQDEDVAEELRLEQPPEARQLSPAVDDDKQQLPPVRFLVAGGSGAAAVRSTPARAAAATIVPLPRGRLVGQAGPPTRSSARRLRGSPRGGRRR